HERRPMPSQNQPAQAVRSLLSLLLPYVLETIVSSCDHHPFSSIIIYGVIHLHSKIASDQSANKLNSFSRQFDPSESIPLSDCLSNFLGYLRVRALVLQGFFHNRPEDLLTESQPFGRSVTGLYVLPKTVPRQLLHQCIVHGPLLRHVRLVNR